MEIMRFLVLALQLLPSIIDAVQAVEVAIQGASGADKKAVVMSAVESAAQAGGKIPEDHVQAVSLLVDNVVAKLNKAGWTGQPKDTTTVTAKV